MAAMAVDNRGIVHATHGLNVSQHSGSFVSSVKSQTSVYTSKKYDGKELSIFPFMLQISSMVSIYARNACVITTGIRKGTVLIIVPNDVAFTSFDRSAIFNSTNKSIATHGPKDPYATKIYIRHRDF